MRFLPHLLFWLILYFPLFFRIIHHLPFLLTQLWYLEFPQRTHKLVLIFDIRNSLFFPVPFHWRTIGISRSRPFLIVLFTRLQKCQIVLKNSLWCYNVTTFTHITLHIIHTTLNTVFILQFTLDLQMLEDFKYDLSLFFWWFFWWLVTSLLLTANFHQEVVIEIAFYVFW